MGDFVFLRPWWLLALLPSLGVVLLLAKFKLESNPWKHYVDEHLLPPLLTTSDQKTRKRPLYGLAALWAFAVLALAGPTLEKDSEYFYRQSGAPLVLVLDLSKNMPLNRLSPIQAKLHELLERLTPRPVGLVVYAQQGHDVFPLTEDRRIIQAVLPKLSPSLMPTQKANPRRGIQKAVQLISNYDQTLPGDILWITDIPLGEGASTIASDLPDRFRLSGYTQAPQSQAMGSITQASGGAVITWQGGDQDIADLISALKRPSPAIKTQAQEPKKMRLDLGPYMLWCLLPLAALCFRRGWVMVLTFLLFMPTSGQAMEWQDLWKTHDQRAHALLERGRSFEAAKLFKDPMWRGIAEARSGQWLKAADAFDQVDSLQGRYNRAVSLARGGKLTKSLSLFDAILKQHPGHQDAAYNRSLVKKVLRQKGKKSPPPSQLGKKGKDQIHTKATQEDQLALRDTPLIKKQKQKTKRTKKAPMGLGGGAAVIPDAKSGKDADKKASTTLGQSSKLSEAQKTEKQSGIQGAGKPKSSSANKNKKNEREKEGKDRGDSREELPRHEAGDDASPNSKKNNSDGKKVKKAGRPVPENAKPKKTKQETISRNWLALVPDDPTPYLKRRFALQHEQHKAENWGGKP